MMHLETTAKVASDIVRRPRFLGLPMALAAL